MHYPDVMMRADVPADFLPQRRFSRLSCWAAVLLCGGAAHCAPAALPGVEQLPANTNLPDPLVMISGRRVASSNEWFQARRPELKTLFQHYVYGSIPPKPEHTQARVQGEFSDFLDGRATLKLVTLETGPAPAPRIDLLMVIPRRQPAPAPVFLAMNFCGNHALTPDPRVPLARGWLYKTCAGCSNNAATAAARGGQAADWPLAEIVRRGYALASFCSSDVDSDRAEVSDGIYAWLAGNDPGRNNPTNRGSIAAWAWGFQRCMDYLVQAREVDGSRIAVLGHSRNGKTALLAGAFDERAGIVFAHQAGCGGSAPSRGKIGESVKAINTGFPHWFNAEFKTFNDAPERLPLDQNCLVALCAPRPVLLSAATGDQWANPTGQFEVARAASPVYELLHAGGLRATEMPPVGQLVNSRLGYYIREGKHSMTPADWQVFMDFADHHWPRGKTITRGP